MEKYGKLWKTVENTMEKYGQLRKTMDNYGPDLGEGTCDDGMVEMIQPGFLLVATCCNY